MEQAPPWMRARRTASLHATTGACRELVGLYRGAEVAVAKVRPPGPNGTARRACRPPMAQIFDF